MSAKESSASNVLRGVSELSVGLSFCIGVPALQSGHTKNNVSVFWLDSRLGDDRQINIFSGLGWHHHIIHMFALLNKCLCVRLSCACLPYSKNVCVSVTTWIISWFGRCCGILDFQPMNDESNECSLTMKGVSLCCGHVFLHPRWLLVLFVSICQLCLTATASWKIDEWTSVVEIQ